MNLKSTSLALVLGIVVCFLSCKKEDTSPNPANSNQKFKFISLDADTLSIKVNGTVNLTANAQGNGLTYTWNYSGGSLIGSGRKVIFTVCHAGKFTVSCDVKDNSNNTDSKQVSIQVHE